MYIARPAAIRNFLAFLTLVTSRFKQVGIVLGKSVAVLKNFQQVGRISGNRGKRRFKLPEPLVMAEFMHINSRHLDPAVASLRHEYAFALKVRPKAFYLPFFFLFPSLDGRVIRSAGCTCLCDEVYTSLRETIAPPVDARVTLFESSRSSTE